MKNQKREHKVQIYTFGLGDKVTEQSSEVLGGKGAGLVWMDSLGVNVPPGFILPCSLMNGYQKSPNEFMGSLGAEITPYLKRMEKKFGYMPLVSVRSGARQSMPGMMDTILNVGLDSKSATEWAERIGASCALDSERRLIEMYASVVRGVDKKLFKDCRDTSAMKGIYQEKTGEEFPDAAHQILGAIEAVFKSWNNERAKIYRKMNNIPEEWGTAVVVQAMVFGNMNDRSGTGVMFSRNPDTGVDEAVGEFLVNAQGEDVVDGSHTPMPLKDMPKWNAKVAKELLAVAEKLEKERRDVQDIEFTVQDGKLFILQTRNAKRQPLAAVKIGLDMLQEGLIDLQMLNKRVSARDLDLAQKTVIDPKFVVEPFATGISASSGVATGRVVLTSTDAINCTEPCILVTEETTPDDIGGMFAAKGILTLKGGMTCHAAVVARGMNKSCVVGLGPQFKDQLKAGDVISIDGASGRVWKGEVPVIDGSKNELVSAYMQALKNELHYIPVVGGSFVVPKHMKSVLYSPQSSTLFSDDDKKKIMYLLSEVDTVYVDLREDRLDSAEAGFFELFDSKANSSASGIENFLNTLDEPFKKKLVVIGASKKMKGIQEIAQVDTLEQLILAKGPVFMGDLTVDKEVLGKVLEWKNGEAETSIYGRYEENKLCFMSDQQALQYRG